MQGGDGHFRESQISLPGLELPLNPMPHMEVLSRQSGASSTPNTFRINAEPHWAVNAQTVCFGIRDAGILVSTLKNSQVLERLQNQLAPCTCGEPQTAVAVPSSERWQAVTVCQILRPSYPGEPKLSAYIRDEDKIIVDIESDEVKRILVVGILRSRKGVICKDCVHCAYNNVREGQEGERCFDYWMMGHFFN